MDAKPGQTDHASAHGTPVHWPLIIPSLVAIDPELPRGVDGHFGAQHRAPFSISFVVQLDRVFPESMFDAHALRTYFQIRDHLMRMRTDAICLTAHFLAHKTHHVRAGQTDHPQMNQLRIKMPQLLRVAEYDIHGPFTLKTSPIVVHGIKGTDFRQ